MKVKEIIDFLENRFPLESQEKWDNSGYLVKGKKETNKVFVTLTLTKGVIKKAIMDNCKLIICHHPIFFKEWESEETPLLDKVKTEELIEILEDEGINLYVLHTNYDKILMNDYLLDFLELDFTEISILDKESNIGKIAKLKKSIELKNLIFKLKSLFSLDSIEISNVNMEKKVEKIALCGGSGKDFLDIAIKEADVYITGDITYHYFEKAVYFDFPVINLGHHMSEEVGFKGIFDLLEERYKGKVYFLNNEDFHIAY